LLLVRMVFYSYSGDVRFQLLNVRQNPFRVIGATVGLLTPIVRLNRFGIPTLDGRKKTGVVLLRLVSVTLGPLC
jgi:hypothetical protein